MISRRGMAVALAAAGLLAPTLVSGQVAYDPALGRVVVTNSRPVRSARRAFAAIIPEVLVKDQPLGKVLDNMRDVSGSNMLVEWKALEAAGVTKDTKVSIALMEIPFGQALGLLMQEAHPTSPVLTYIDMNVIHVTSQADADTHLITRAYPVQDLTMANVHQIIPQGGGINNGNNNNNNNNNNNQPTGTTGAGGINYASGLGQQTGQGQNQNGNQFNNNGNNNNGNGNNGQNTQQLIQQAQKQAGADLVNLVKTSIRPDIWKDDKGGGGPASIIFFNGNLVVSAPIYVQEAIGGPVPGH